VLLQRACSTASNAARSLPNGLLSMTTSRCRSFGLLEPAGIGAVGNHDARSRPENPRFAASISAAMFDPRPEIRMATRRFIASPRQIEVTVIDHAMLARGRDHFAEQRDGLAASVKNVGDLLDRIGFTMAIMPMPQLKVRSIRVRRCRPARQPFEHRQHRQPREIDADAEMLWQHARNVVGEAAAGDVGQPLTAPVSRIARRQDFT
jgi:hypothetical protein